MNIIGHDKQSKYFNHVIKNGILGHAYVFTGPEMIGKRTLALELFRTINGRDSSGDPDFKFLGPKISEGESKIYIEDIRDLKSFFSLKPYRGPYKFALIDDAHVLTAEAANALLKILEEPPAFSVIVLVTNLAGTLPGTIISRCEEVKFVLANPEEMALYFSKHKKLNQEDMEFLVKLSGGRIGLADKISQGNGLADAKKAVDDLRKLLNSGICEKLDYAKKVHEKGDYRPKIDYWLDWVSAHVSTAPKNEKIVKDLLSLHQIISQPQFNHRLALESFLLSL